LLNSFNPMLLRSRKRRSFSPMEYRFKPCVIVSDCILFPFSFESTFPVRFEASENKALALLYSKSCFP